MRKEISKQKSSSLVQLNIVLNMPINKKNVLNPLKLNQLNPTKLFFGTRLLRLLPKSFMI